MGRRKGRTRRRRRGRRRRRVSMRNSRSKRSSRSSSSRLDLVIKSVTDRQKISSLPPFLSRCAGQFDSYTNWKNFLIMPSIE